MENSNKRRRIDEEQNHTPFEFFSSDVLDSEIPSIHVLNDDCLDVIFDRLKFAELLEIATVCKRWYNAVLYKFSRVEEFDVDAEVDYNYVTVSDESSRRFELIILRHTKGNLKIFRSSSKQEFACPAHLKRVLRQTPNLETLDYFYGYGQYKNSGDEISFSKTMAQYLPKSIRKLELPFEINWNLVTKDLPNLESISAVFSASSNQLRVPTNLEFIKDNLRNNKLRRLRLYIYMPDITADTFKFILRNYFLTLEDLDITFCPWIASALVFSSTDVEPLLARMTRFSCKGVLVDKTLAYVLKLMPNLEELTLSLFVHDIDHIQDRSALVYSLTDMEPLTRMKRFSCNGDLADKTLHYVLQVLKLMPNLEELLVYLHPKISNEVHGLAESISNRLAENLPKSIRKLAIVPSYIFQVNLNTITASLPNLEIFNDQCLD